MRLDIEPKYLKHLHVHVHVALVLINPFKPWSALLVMSYCTLHRKGGTGRLIGGVTSRVLGR